MKNKLLNTLCVIVGSPYGFFGEGNRQWYYFLSFVINGMLLWCYAPALVAIAFVTFMVFHYILVAVCGYADLCADFSIASYIFFIISFLLVVLGFIISLKWVVITAIITLFLLSIAPDECGINFYTEILNKSVKRMTIPLTINTITFVVFVILTFCLPFSLLTKIIIIVSCIVLHPIIDMLEGECIVVTDVVSDAFYKIKDTLKK